MTDATDVRPEAPAKADQAAPDAFLAALDWEKLEQQRQERQEECREILLGSVNP
ncbi:hypothetical protein [Deinococcus sp. PEB2-63]